MLLQNNEVCRACGGSNVYLRYSSVPDYYFNTKYTGDIYECRVCGSLNNFMGEPSAKEYLNYYTSEQVSAFEERTFPYFQGLSVIKEINDWSNGIGPMFDGLNSKLKILDYGCGSGNFGEYLENLGHEVYLYDPFENPTSESCTVISNMSAAPMDLDIIFLNHVIEHVHDPLKVITLLKPHVKKGGAIIVSTPNALSLSRKIFGRFWRGMEYPRHRCIFSANGLIELARQANLKPSMYLISRSSREMGFVSLKMSAFGVIYNKYIGYLYQVVQHYLARLIPDLNEEIFVKLENDS